MRDGKHLKHRRDDSSGTCRPNSIDDVKRVRLRFPGGGWKSRFRRRQLKISRKGEGFKGT